LLGEDRVTESTQQKCTAKFPAVTSRQKSPRHTPACPQTFHHPLAKDASLGTTASLQAQDNCSAGLRLVNGTLSGNKAIEAALLNFFAHFKDA
jgi:hypothetical protein